MTLKTLKKHGSFVRNLKKRRCKSFWVVNNKPPKLCGVHTRACFLEERPCFKSESDAIRFAAQHRIVRVVPTPSRPLGPQQAFDGQDVADRTDRGEDVKIGSLTQFKNLALLTILEPALFKHVLAEERATIKIEKTRTADLEILMVESGLEDDRKEARNLFVKKWKPEMVAAPPCPCELIETRMTCMVIGCHRYINFAQVPMDMKNPSALRI